MHQFGVAIHLGAGKASGEWLVRVAFDADHPAVFDVCQQGAHVRTIVGTDDPFGFHSLISGKAIKARVGPMVRVSKAGSSGCGQTIRAPVAENSWPMPPP